jgi:hypothetical protein
MTFSKSFLALGFAAALSFAVSAPAYAQRGGGGHGGGGGHAVARSGGHAVYSGGGHAVVYGGGHGAVYGGGYYGHGGHYTVVGYAPYHPYYYYRPGVSIGFYAGFGYGYPYYGYGYPYYYGYPYAYSYPYPYAYNPYPYYSYPAYSYPQQQQPAYPQTQQAPPQSQQQSYQDPPPPGTVTAQPGQATYGGIQLQDAPRGGQVYVDGHYAGVVEDFDGGNRHLNLTAGVHQVEIRVNGQQPMSFDVQVPPNQTITIHVQ